MKRSIFILFAWRCTHAIMYLTRYLISFRIIFESNRRNKFTSSSFQLKIALGCCFLFANLIYIFFVFASYYINKTYLIFFSKRRFIFSRLRYTYFQRISYFVRVLCSNVQWRFVQTRVLCNILYYVSCLNLVCTYLDDNVCFNSCIVWKTFFFVQTG